MCDMAYLRLRSYRAETEIKSPESLSNALQPFYFPRGHLVKDLDS